MEGLTPYGYLIQIEELLDSAVNELTPKEFKELVQDLKSELESDYSDD